MKMVVAKEVFDRPAHPPRWVAGVSYEKIKALEKEWIDSDPLKALNAFIEEHVSPDRVINVQYLMTDDTESYVLLYWKWEKGDTE